MRPNQHQTWIWWDLTEFGSTNLQAISQAEMRELLRGAEVLIDNHPAEEIDQLIQDQTRNLQREADRRGISDYWISRAVLLVALKGLKGQEIPWHLDSQD